MTNYIMKLNPLMLGLSACLMLTAANAAEDTHQHEHVLPISDTHLHYSHDSVEMTPPERVIEIMREANLKLALVSSSDDNGTQLLSDLAPDLIVPGLRPYRKRGETGTWFKDETILDYVEALLEENSYATIGEFHLYGENAELPIPKRIVELAVEHNLILHAHSDAEAVERLLAQDPTVKVLWAHSGFDSPEEIAAMLGKHDRLWADLAFRSEVGSGGKLSEDWIKLFTDFPDRMMLGTDSYTPERMFYIPEHAESARQWLTSLPQEVAENVAWKNGHNLLMPVWNKNRIDGAHMAKSKHDSMSHGDHKHDTMSVDKVCNSAAGENDIVLRQQDSTIRLHPQGDIKVSEPLNVLLTLCGNNTENVELALDALMPAHGHGMNYEPVITEISRDNSAVQYQVEGLVLHMPGNWQWQVEVKTETGDETLQHDFNVE